MGARDGSGSSSAGYPRWVGVGGLIPKTNLWVMPEVPLTVIPCFPALVCRLLPESSSAFPLNGISFTPSRKVTSPEGQPVVAKSQHRPPTPPLAFCSLTEKNQDQDKWRPLKKGLLAEQKGLRLALLPEPLDLDSASDHLAVPLGLWVGCRGPQREMALPRAAH